MGMVSGGLTAFGAHPRSTFEPVILLKIALGATMAAVLNAASNGINQICDLELDRVNKPQRALVTGAMSLREAGTLTGALYLVALVLASLINLQCLLLAGTAAILTWVYSAPPLRSKRHGWWANITIAVPRGLLLKVCGWATVKSFMSLEPWYIGSVFFLFILGGSSTKDFADMEGDRLGGCQTLPIRYGVRRAAWMISPSFVLPFIMLPVGTKLGILSGNPALLDTLGACLALWGCYTVYLLVRRPDELASTENHPSWTHMYLMMMALQVGFAVSYLF
jgi:4-hydroxybenzoate polyprenyltransferase